jgi:hypothetical protein
MVTKRNISNLTFEHADKKLSVLIMQYNRFHKMNGTMKRLRQLSAKCTVIVEITKTISYLITQCAVISTSNQQFILTLSWAPWFRVILCAKCTFHRFYRLSLLFAEYTESSVAG